MFTKWTKHYEEGGGRSSVVGWKFDSEEDCMAYFSSRVRAKLKRSDSTSLLQEYLLEMADTGFSLDALQNQTTNPPIAKDWEIGEAFAESMLEDKFEASFPWPTGWDKRAIRASLQGPDLPGFSGKSSPVFLFGEVKSSSENRFPPQVVTQSNDCLRAQLDRLLKSDQRRLQLIGWLLVRARNSERWLEVFNRALKSYLEGKLHICGVLVRGGIEPSIEDLSRAHKELAEESSTFTLTLLGFHVPFDKSRWVELAYGKGAVS